MSGVERAGSSRDWDAEERALRALFQCSICGDTLLVRSPTSEELARRGLDASVERIYLTSAGCPTCDRLPRPPGGNHDA